MADVTGRGPSRPSGQRDRTPARNRDRGQLFLVAAISLAVLFVALALFLNTAIYTQNLVTRTSNTGPDAAIQYRAGAGDGAAGAVRYANYHNFTDETTLYRSLANETLAWTSLAGRQAAIEGQVTNGTLVAVRNGTRITQNDSARNFTSSDADGNRQNWTVVDSTERVRNFTMTVDPTQLQSATLGPLLGSEAFRVNLSDPSSSDAWNVVAYKTLSPSELHIVVVDPGGTKSTCPAQPYTPGDRISIDVTDHTVGGEPCPALDVFDDLPAQYRVQFNESQNVAGTYALVVPDGATVDSTPYASVGSGESPYTVPAVYSATLNVTYRSPDVYYRTNVTVAPGEPDAAA